VYVTSTPTLALSKPGYENSEDVLVSYSNSVILSYDWIGIYRISDTPGVMNATLWKYITGPEGEIVFTGLPDGYYFVTYFLNDGYTEACERIIFPLTGSGQCKCRQGKLSDRAIRNCWFWRMDQVQKRTGSDC
jgi:hypothetical protein